MASRFLRSATLALCLAALGCAQPAAPLTPSTSPLQVTVPGNGTLTAVAQLALTDAAGRQLLAVVEPWKPSDIDQVTLSLYRGAETTALTQLTVNKGNLAQKLTFSNLSANTSYRIVARAFNGNTPIDAGEAACTTNFATTNVANLEKIKLKLADKAFAGKTKSSSIEVTPGGYVDPTLAETAFKLEDSTYAGSGTPGYQDGPAATARFDTPCGIAVDAQGNVYVGDNSSIRKITPDGTVSTLAGNGVWGFQDGIGAAARFGSANSLVVDAQSKYLYVADQGTQSIRRVEIATGDVETIAGNGTDGDGDGAGRDEARFNSPSGLALDASGQYLYVADSENHRVCQVTIATGEVETIASRPTDDKFQYPYSLVVDATGQSLYLSDCEDNQIYKVTITTGEVSTYAGSGEEDFEEGVGTQAKFNHPYGLVLDASKRYLYLADSGNNRIRKVDTTTGTVSTYAGSGAAGLLNGPRLSALFDSPDGMAMDAHGTLFVAENNNHCVRKLR